MCPQASHFISAGAGTHPDYRAKLNVCGVQVPQVVPTVAATVAVVAVELIVYPEDAGSQGLSGIAPPISAA